MKLSRSLLVLSSTVLSSRILGTKAIIEECIADAEKIYIEQDGILFNTARDMMKEYNVTCHEQGLCRKEIDQQTYSYITNPDVVSNLQIPDHPLVATIHADFLGFENDPSYVEFQNVCKDVVKDGLHCTSDADVILKGEAFDTVTMDSQSTLRNVPLCLVDTCEDEDIIVIAETALRKVLLAYTAEAEQKLSRQQIMFLSSMTAPVACAASGLDTCIIEIYNLKCDGGEVVAEDIVEEENEFDESTVAESSSVSPMSFKHSMPIAVGSASIALLLTM